MILTVLSSFLLVADMPGSRRFVPSSDRLFGRATEESSQKGRPCVHSVVQLSKSAPASVGKEVAELLLKFKPGSIENDVLSKQFSLVPFQNNLLLILPARESFPAGSFVLNLISKQGELASRVYLPKSWFNDRTELQTQLYFWPGSRRGVSNRLVLKVNSVDRASEEESFERAYVQTFLAVDLPSSGNLPATVEAYPLKGNAKARFEKFLKAKEEEATLPMRWIENHNLSKSSRNNEIRAEIDEANNRTTTNLKLSPMNQDTSVERKIADGVEGLSDLDILYFFDTKDGRGYSVDLFGTRFSSLLLAEVGEKPSVFMFQEDPQARPDANLMRSMSRHPDYKGKFLWPNARLLGLVDGKIQFGYQPQGFIEWATVMTFKDSPVSQVLVVYERNLKNFGPDSGAWDDSHSYRSELDLGAIGSSDSVERFDGDKIVFLDAKTLSAVLEIVVKNAVGVGRGRSYAENQTVWRYLRGAHGLIEAFRSGDLDEIDSRFIPRK